LLIAKRDGALVQLGIGMEFDLYYLATVMPRYMEVA